MISGARELMTPGAWQPNGATYKLRDKVSATTDHSSEQEIAARRLRLKRLAASLMTFADEHGGRFPTQAEFEELPNDIRRFAGASGLHFAYVPHLDRQGEPRMLAFEPVSYGSLPLALFTDGAIRQADGSELDKLQYGEIR
jgi:hypothetical protein